MYCNKCGKEIPEGSAFCLACGAKVEDITENNSNAEVENASTKVETSDKKASIKEFISKYKIILIIAAVIVIAAIVGIIIYNAQPSTQFKKAESAFENGNYDTAIKYYEKLGEYGNSDEKLVTAKKAKHYSDGTSLFESGDYDLALSEFEEAEDYEDAEEMVKACYYNKGINLINNSEYLTAIEVLENAEGYQDVENLINQARYAYAESLKDSGKFIEAAEQYEKCIGYSDSNDKIIVMGEQLVNDGQYADAISVFDVSESNQENKMRRYALGMIEFENGNYELASKYFDNVKSEIPDAETKYQESQYMYAKDLMAKRDYATALNVLENIKNYKDVSSIINTCALNKAHGDMLEGNLNTAKKILEGLPAGTADGKLNSAELLEKLNKNDQWLKLCGKWGSVSGEARSTQQGSYRSWWWHRDIGKNASTLDIKCILNDNGTTTVKVDGSLFVYLNYSSIQQGLDTTNWRIKATKDLTKMESIKADNCTTIKLGTDTVSVSYYKKDNSQDVYFTYIYKTDAKYKKISDY